MKCDCGTTIMQKPDVPVTDDLLDAIPEGGVVSCWECGRRYVKTNGEWKIEKPRIRFKRSEGK